MHDFTSSHYTLLLQASQQLDMSSLNFTTLCPSEPYLTRQNRAAFGCFFTRLRLAVLFLNWLQSTKPRSTGLCSTLLHRIRMCLCCSLLNNAQLRSTTLNSTQHDFAPLCSIGVFLCFAVQNWAALYKRSTAYYLTLLYRDVSLLDRAVQYNTIQNNNKHYFASIHFGKVVQLHFIWMLSSH